MKHISIRHYLLGALGLFAFLATSCIKEDLDECYKLTLKVENFLGEDITGKGWRNNTSLYIFDENLNFLEIRKLDKEFVQSRKEIVLDNYPASRQLRIIAWSDVNVLGDKQVVSEAQTIQELTVMLKSQDGLAVTPDSLYYGSQLVTTKAGGVAQNTEIVIRPKVGTVEIETIGLQEELLRRGLTNVNECEFSLNNTLNGFNYEGELIGDSVRYKPEGNWNKNQQEWYTPVDQTALPGQGMAVSISANGVSLGTGYVDAEYNEPIQVKVGQKTLLRLTWEDGNLSVRMSIRPWGVVDEEIPLH